jgi:hypothetical protein
MYPPRYHHLFFQAFPLLSCSLTTGVEGCVCAGAEGDVCAGVEGDVCAGAEGVFCAGAEGDVCAGAEGVFCAGVEGDVCAGAEGVFCAGVEGCVLSLSGDAMGAVPLSGGASVEVWVKPFWTAKNNRTSAAAINFFFM